MLVLARRGEVGQQGPLRATQLLRLSSKSIIITMGNEDGDDDGDVYVDDDEKKLTLESQDTSENLELTG